MQNNNDLNAVVIGAGGGIGSEFVNQLAQDPTIGKIHAFSSSPKPHSSSKVSPHQINIHDESSIQECAKSVQGSIDIVIVAIGMLHDDEANIMPEKSLRELSYEKFEAIFRVNTIAPALIAKHFVPLLSRKSKSIFAALSARVGSISDNQMGGWYSYRASKAALNMLIKNTAIEIGRNNKNAIIVGMHPGTVDTKLSSPFQAYVTSNKLFSPQYSVSQMLSALQNLEPKDTGNLFDYAGLKVEF